MLLAARSLARRGLCTAAEPPAPHRLRAGLALATVGLIGVFVAKDRVDKTEEQTKTKEQAGKLSPEQEVERKQFETYVVRVVACPGGYRRALFFRWF